MADTLAVDIKTSLNWSFQNPLALGTLADVSKLEYAGSISNGTSTNQADELWHSQRVLSSISFEDIDLTNLTNQVFGNTITINLARVKVLMIINTSTTSGDELLIGGAGSANNAWSGPFYADQDTRIGVPSGSVLLLTNKLAGWAVTNNASDILRIDNSTPNSITYQIVLVGTSI